MSRQDAIFSVKICRREMVLVRLRFAALLPRICEGMIIGYFKKGLLAKESHSQEAWSVHTPHNMDAYPDRDHGEGCCEKALGNCCQNVRRCRHNGGEERNVVDIVCWRGRDCPATLR